MLKKHALCLVGSIFIALVSLLSMFRLVQADPSNAILHVTVNNPNPEVGEVITVLFTLDAMDPEEAFYDWKVRLGFSPTALTFVPDSCWLNPGVWFSDTTFVFSTCSQTTDTIYVGDLNLAGHSITSTPIVLGSARFTVNAVSGFGFDVITDTELDTNFFRPDDSFWQPGDVRLTGPNAVTLQSFIARSGAGVAAGVGLAAAGAGIVLRRKRRPAIANDGP